MIYFRVIKYFFSTAAKYASIACSWGHLLILIIAMIILGCYQFIKFFLHLNIIVVVDSHSWPLLGHVLIVIACWRFVVIYLLVGIILIIVFRRNERFVDGIRLRLLTERIQSSMSILYGCRRQSTSISIKRVMLCVI
jgi:hypothetical protein